MIKNRFGKTLVFLCTEVLVHYYNMYVCVRACACACVCVCMCVCVCVYTYIHTYIWQ
jgi:hypothetical protein